MQILIPVLIVVAIAVLLLLLKLMNWYRRPDVMQKLAKELGFAYSNIKANEISLPGVILTMADSIELPALHGTYKDHDITIMDNINKIDDETVNSTMRQTILIIKTHKQMPKLALGPRDLLDAASLLIGKEDIRFDSHRAFNARFTLRGEDELAVRQLFNLAVLDFIEKLNPRLCIEAFNDNFLIYYRKKTLNPRQIKSLLESGMILLNKMGDY